MKRQDQRLRGSVGTIPATDTQPQLSAVAFANRRS